MSDITVADLISEYRDGKRTGKFPLHEMLLYEPDLLEISNDGKLDTSALESMKEMMNGIDQIEDEILDDLLEEDEIISSRLRASRGRQSRRRKSRSLLDLDLEEDLVFKSEIIKEEENALIYKQDIPDSGVKTQNHFFTNRLSSMSRVDWRKIFFKNVS